MRELVDIRVELPAFSKTLTVRVPHSGTVLDVKHEIHRVCVGAPRVDGQRVIWRGRPLFDDERIAELWKTPDEPRIVHLAVHPSGWTSSPPQAAPPPTPSFVPPSFASQPIPRPVTTSPLAYVTARHEQALNALEQAPVPRLEADILALRAAAVQVVENHGWAWPPVLDEEFPLAEPGGVKYQRTVMDGHSYLRLVEPAGQPTALQLHALKVLAVSFSIFTIPPPPSMQTRVMASSQPPPELQAILQQLNPVVRTLAENAARQAPPPPPVEIPLRPLVLPLFLLMLRTTILLYFFAPARKPVFGILVIAWMLYEVWRPIRDGLNRGINRAAEQQQNQPAAGGNDQPPAQADVAPQPAQAAGPGDLNPPLARRRRPAARAGGGAANEFDQQVDAIIEGLANVNMDNEEDLFRGNAPEPRFGSKVITFFTLFFATLHPAIWNRRRAVLRQRETRLRMDANARAAELDASDEDPAARARFERQQQLIAQHAERPQWLRAYIDRVVEGAWVDEAD